MQRRDLSKLILASAAGSAALTSRAQAQTCTPPCYPQTASELAASITPVDTSFPPGNVKRYGALGKPLVAGTPTTPAIWNDDQVAIQRAIDSGAGVVFFPNGTYKIGAPLLIKPTSTQNLTLLGEGRTNTYLAPFKVNIADALGQNAMIIVCHEHVAWGKRRGTVREMRVGPSHPTIRSWMQTAASCCC